MQNQVQQQQQQQQQAVQAAQQAVAVAQQQQQQQAQQQQMIRNVNQGQNQQYSNVSNTGGFLRPPQAPRSWQMMQNQQRQPNQASALIAQLTTPTFQQRLDSK
jgi:hypothetical protein